MQEEPKILKMSARSTIGIDAIFGKETNSCAATEAKPKPAEKEEPKEKD